jgi:hypothetical protein
MTPRSWLRTLFGPQSGPQSARGWTRPRTRLTLERLEDRLASAVRSHGLLRTHDRAGDFLARPAVEQLANG